jgi:predicted nuclease of predicted toxin-antitoxin system
MQFLVDANLSPRVATTLSSEGFKSIHVGDVGLLTAADKPSWTMRPRMNW